MRRIAIVAALVGAAVGVPAVFAADSGTGGADGPYVQAHNVGSPLGPLYGPVRAGDDSSTSYGYVSR